MHDDGYFGERVAARYDDDAAIFEPAVVDPVVDLLVELAGSGRALELGIGTGRIARPLARRGVQVHGIELSNAMATRLHRTAPKFPVASRSTPSATGAMAASR